jgi:hypothetical protein
MLPMRWAWVNKMSNDTFSISDIQKIRYDNFEETKAMTAEELIARTKTKAEIIKRRLKKGKIKS